MENSSVRRAPRIHLERHHVIPRSLGMLRFHGERRRLIQIDTVTPFPLGAVKRAVRM